MSKIGAMATCRQYWEIAERHSAIFTEIQELKEAAVGSNVDAALRALKGAIQVCAHGT